MTTCQDLITATENLLDLYSAATEATDTYCEVCETHAYKHTDPVGSGNWTGEVDPIIHKPDCIIGIAILAVLHAKEQEQA